MVAHLANRYCDSLLPSKVAFRLDVFSARHTARRAKVTPETGMRAGPIGSRFLPCLTALQHSQPGGPGVFHEGTLVFPAGLRWPNSLCNGTDFRRPFSRLFWAGVDLPVGQDEPARGNCHRQK